jgi:predicted TIM-barrel fold metal-dependent hydrolase
MVVLPGAAEQRRADSAELPPARADHHLHIQSPNVTAELKRRFALNPEQFAIFDPALMETRTGSAALAVLDEAGIEQGALLSMAYIFASPRATVPASEAAGLTRIENEWNVAAALASAGRLKAFISVNPFSTYAIDELRHWHGRSGVTGLKLHLSNSDFDWHADQQVERLAYVFAAAREQSMPVIVHARAGGDYDAGETRRFIERVIAQAGDLQIQIAHGGGGGGLDEATLYALALYGDAIDRGSPGTRNMVFDLAAVLVRDSAEPHSASMLRQMAERMRKIGLDRFLMASDWPSVLAPREHNEWLQAQIPLTTDEWRLVLSNRASYFERRPATGSPPHHNPDASP